MKKLTPYILAYLIVTTCTAFYPYIYRHVFMSSLTEVMPQGSVAVVLNPGMSHDELVAKLQQVGLSETQTQHAPSVRPAPVLTAVFQLVYHYTFDAVIFTAFAGLVIFFSGSPARMFQTMTMLPNVESDYSASCLNGLDSNHFIKDSIRHSLGWLAPSSHERIIVAVTPIFGQLTVGKIIFRSVGCESSRTGL